MDTLQTFGVTSELSKGDFIRRLMRSASSEKLRDL